MASGTKLSRALQFLADLTVAGWVSAFDALACFAPRARSSPTLLAKSYEAMQERLRTSLEEIEQKKRQLQESEEEVRRSRDFLQAVIDSLDDDLMVLDQWYHITQANRSLSHKHPREEVIGRCCYEVTHGSSSRCKPPLCKCPLVQVWETGIPARVVHIHPGGQDGLTRDKYVEVSASPLCDSSGKVIHVVEMMRDVTESKEQEKQVVDANRRLLALNAIADTVSQSLSLDSVLNSALDHALEQMNAEVGGILLIDDKTGALAYKTYRGLSDQFVAETARLGAAAGVVGSVAQSGEILFRNDLSKEINRTLVIGEEGLKAFIAVPLKSKDKTVGFLTIASRQPRPFSDQEVQLLTALGHQLGVAIENAQLYQELQTKEHLRANILRKVITAQEDERRRVARELHDVTSQALATLAMRLEVVMATPTLSANSLENRLAELKPLLDQTSKDVHRLIYDLRPSLLDDLGLPAAIRSCAHNALDPAGIVAHVEIVGQERRLPSATEIAAFRIVQEAITNIARHSHAESAYISLEFKNKGFCVQIEDDGIGFDLAHVFGQRSAPTSIGLLGMKERAELIGGSLDIHTGPKSGTRIIVKIPDEMSADD